MIVPMKIVTLLCIATQKDATVRRLQELGLLLNKMDLLSHVRKARLRVKYGIKEELLPLVKIRGVGRARARMLFNRGYKSLEKIRSAPVTAIAQVVGPNIAKDIKRQLSGPEKEKSSVTDDGATSLEQY